MDDEAEWINNASTGAIIYSEPYKGNGYKYDFCSMYPSIMAHQLNWFPYKRGEFKKINQNEFIQNPLEIGIYRCIIEKQNTKICNFFRFNKYNYYTMKDIKVARDIGLTITMIDDNEPNLLYYTKDKCICGSKLFGKFVNTLFPIKQKKVKTAKLILNCLWGSLVQKKIIQHKINIDDEPYDLGHDTNLEALHQLNNTTWKIDYTIHNKQFETNYARIKPFLISYGRYVLYNNIKNFVDDIVHAHTDGFITKRDVNIKTGFYLGEIKFEGHDENTIIKNCNDYQFLSHKLRE